MQNTIVKKPHKIIEKHLDKLVYNGMTFIAYIRMLHGNSFNPHYVEREIVVARDLGASYLNRVVIATLSIKDSGFHVIAKYANGEKSLTALNEVQLIDTLNAVMSDEYTMGLIDAMLLQCKESNL